MAGRGSLREKPCAGPVSIYHLGAHPCKLDSVRLRVQAPAILCVLNGPLADFFFKLRRRNTASELRTFPFDRA